MTDQVLVAVITAIPPTLVAGGAILIGLLNKRDIQHLHLAVNSRLTQLLEQTAKASHAEGVADGERR